MALLGRRIAMQPRWAIHGHLHDLPPGRQALKRLLPRDVTTASRRPSRVTIAIRFAAFIARRARSLSAAIEARRGADYSPLYYGGAAEDRRLP